MIFYIEKLDVNEEKAAPRQTPCIFYRNDGSPTPRTRQKLGFIAQEMGREINTLGSKSNHAEMQAICGADERPFGTNQRAGAQRAIARACTSLQVPDSPGLSQRAYTSLSEEKPQRYLLLPSRIPQGLRLFITMACGIDKRGFNHKWLANRRIADNKLQNSVTNLERLPRDKPAPRRQRRLPPAILSTGADDR